MRFGVAALLLVAACKFEPQRAGNDGPPPIDAPEIDAPPPDAFDPKCFGGGDFYLCLGAEPMEPELRLDGGTIDTSTCTLGELMQMVDGTAVCTIARTAIRIINTNGVIGDRPLVLVATTTITLESNAVLDVSAPGPRAPDTACNDAGNGMNGNSGASGGAGGSFGSSGGNGANGSTTILGGTAGDVIAAPVRTLRGGCPGGTGGDGGGGSNTVAGGLGGGAVLLVAREAIGIEGTINASGTGATGGKDSFGGGGGGGSGGMIAFHTTLLTVQASGRIVANGGGGGGGAGNGDPGDPGANPDPTMPAIPALGGQAATAGRSRGGNGFAGISAATTPANSATGGGGGGGGAGVIRVLAGGTIPAANVSPAPN
jgi:hypothetical protein